MAKSTGYKNRYKAKKGKNEKVSGSVYTARPARGKSDDVRMRQLVDNEYGKRPTPEPSMPQPLPGMARMTQRIVR